MLHIFHIVLNLPIELAEKNLRYDFNFFPDSCKCSRRTSSIYDYNINSVSPNHTLWHHRSPPSSLELPSSHYPTLSPIHRLSSLPQTRYKHVNCARTKSLPQDHSPTGIFMQTRNFHLEPGYCDFDSCHMTNLTEEQSSVCTESASYIPISTKLSSDRHSIEYDQIYQQRNETKCYPNSHCQEMRDHNQLTEIVRITSPTRDLHTILPITTSGTCYSPTNTNQLSKKQNCSCTGKIIDDSNNFIPLSSSSVYVQNNTKDVSLSVNSLRSNLSEEYEAMPMQPSTASILDISTINSLPQVTIISDANTIRRGTL